MFARDLAVAATPDEAVQVATDLCARGMEVPAAVWLSDQPGDPRRLIGVWGAGREAVAVLSREVPTLPADGYRSDAEPPEREAFRRAFDLDRVCIVPAGAATIFVGDPNPLYRGVLEAIGSLLAETLENVGRREVATSDEELQLGLAVTAHELRAPLLGARAALEQLLHDDPDPRPEAGVLRRTAFELDALSRKVDGLLRWSVGADDPERETCDLVRVAREAIATCVLEMGEDRFVLHAPEQLHVVGASGHLRMAVENLLRNALAYSPARTKVTVVVEADDGCAFVTVRDEGPGVPAPERDTMFDAFRHGSTGRARSGHGLGLFITKRVVVAHGGDVWCDPVPSGGGSMFRIRLPKGMP